MEEWRPVSISLVDDASLSAPIKQSQIPGVWLVDEAGAREWIEFRNYYDYTLWQATKAEELRKVRDQPATAPNLAATAPNLPKPNGRPNSGHRRGAVALVSP
jgi:hypothetical protein